MVALFITLLFSSGLGFYNHTVVLQALVLERGFSVTMASTAVSIFFLCSGLIGLQVAASLEKHDIRLVICTGAVLASASLFSIGLVTQEWQVFLAYAVFGVGFAASGLLPATTLVTRWFEERRAIALSVASTGLSVGGIVVTPASALLLEQLGLTFSTRLFALVYLLGTVPLTLIILRSYPGDIGLQIDGGIEDADNHWVPSGTDYRDAIREKYFWGLSISYLFLMLAQVGGIAHQFGLLSEKLEPELAVAALSVIPAASILGRLAGGVFVDRFGTGIFSLVMMLLQFIALLSLGLADSIPVFLISLALFGITIGNLLMLQPLLIAEVYGQISYSRIYGLSNLLTTFGVALGPFLLGYIYSSDSSYIHAYVIASLAGLAGFIIYLTVKHLTDKSSQQKE